MCGCIDVYVHGNVLERFDFVSILVVFALAQKLTQICLFIDENQSDAQTTPSANEYKSVTLLCEQRPSIKFEMKQRFFFISIDFRIIISFFLSSRVGTMAYFLCF